MDSGSKLHAVPWMIRVLGGRLWMVVALAGLVVVLMIVVQRIAELFDLVKTLFRF